MTKRLKQSAGLLMFRGTEDAYEVFLVHPGTIAVERTDHLFLNSRLNS
jgi:predicted NUDIX family NTP pyrophosphohydrolase